MTDKSKEMLEDGIVAGLIGYATVCIVFAISNLVEGRSIFFTPAVLGASLFYGIDDPSKVEILPQYVFAYNGAHLVVFLLLGIASSWLACISERGAQLWFVAVFIFLVAVFHVVGAAQAVALPMQALMSGPAVWTAGILAAIGMGAYLLWQHPVLRRQMGHWQESEI